MIEPLLLARSLKLLAEIALFAWLGQGALGLLLGARRHHNPVHGLFRAVTAPARWVGDRLWPATWPERRRAVLTFVLLLAVWAGALAWKVQLCRSGAACT